MDVIIIITHFNLKNIKKNDVFFIDRYKIINKYLIEDRYKQSKKL